jgi:hypothetical protein
MIRISTTPSEMGDGLIVVSKRSNSTFIMLYFVGVFCTSKIHSGQDHVFLFQGGIVNYKAHYGLSWFRPLLRGNSHTSNSLILKMNSGYNGVSRELNKFMK